MQSMRHILQQSLGRSLEAMPELDRLQAAWPVACGKAMAAQGEITGFAAGVVSVHVHNDAWLDQMRSMGAVLQRELAKIARVRVTGIHFEGTAKPNPARRSGPQPVVPGRTREKTSTMSGVTTEDVRRVAELANLELTAAEEPRMQRDLSAILGYIAQLGELDTTGIEPMAQVGDIVGDLPDRAADTDGAALRRDGVRPSIDRKSVMHEAPESDGRFFKVPKVIER